MVPLGKAPEESWLRHMQWPADDITVEGAAFRVPMTGDVRANLGSFLDRLDAGISKANDRAAEETERQRVESERHQQKVKLAKEKMAADLDTWWDEKRTITD